MSKQTTDPTRRTSAAAKKGETKLTERESKPAAVTEDLSLEKIRAKMAVQLSEQDMVAIVNVLRDQIRSEVMERMAILEVEEKPKARDADEDEDEASDSEGSTDSHEEKHAKKQWQKKSTQKPYSTAMNAKSNYA